MFPFVFFETIEKHQTTRQHKNAENTDDHFFSVLSFKLNSFSKLVITEFNAPFSFLPYPSHVLFSGFSELSSPPKQYLDARNRENGRTCLFNSGIIMMMAVSTSIFYGERSSGLGELFPATDSIEEKPKIHIPTSKFFPLENQFLGFDQWSQFSRFFYGVYENLRGTFSQNLFFILTGNKKCQEMSQKK